MKLIRPLETPSDFVEALEGCGADLEAFCVEYSPMEDYHVWLFHVHQKLSADPQKLKRWHQSIAEGLAVRLALLQQKAVSKMEEWQNKSDANSAPDIAFAKLLLDDILTEKSESAKWRVAQPFRRELKTMGADTAEPTEESDSNLDQLVQDLAS